MTFLNAGILFGLLLLALPVLLHLLNRGRSHTVPWGAMDFLLRSIALRNRRIRFEEALLLALRCLLLALLVLAMARPFLPSRGTVSWIMLMLMFAAAAICAGVAGALWDQRRVRNILAAVAMLLLALGVAGAVMERWLQARWWNFGGGERDLAILVDGSTAMALPYDEHHSLYEQALTEARELANALRPGDTVVIMIGASTPIPLIARPTSDRREIGAALDAARLTPPGGRFAFAETLNAAVSALAAGRNPHKTVILIGAGHRAGLVPEQAAQWDFLGSRMDALLPVRPDLIYRRLQSQTGRESRNLAVSPPLMSRRLADIARPIRISAEIVNTGLTALSPGRIELHINDEKIDERSMAAEIAPGSSETITFTHQFTEAGPHAVAVRLGVEDDIATDNHAVRMVHVQDRLPVLIVDGAPATRRLRSAASFITIALDPAEDEREGLMRRIWAFARGAGDEPVDPEPAIEHRNLVQPDVRSITDLGAISDLRQYRAVILVNVPRLPDAFAARLADAVRDGIGLWIIPGHLSRAEHFDQWRSGAGEPLWPAAPRERITLGRNPVGPQVRSFIHPAHRLLAQDRQSDAESLRVHAYWRLTPDANDPNVRTAGVLLNGDPFMLERSFGKGSIIMTSFMLDREDSNLPSLKAFVPLVHETLYYLVNSTIPDDNTQPGREFTTSVAVVPESNTPAAPPGAASVPQAVAITAPSGRELAGRITPTSNGLRVTCPDTIEAGLYRARIPDELAAGSVSNRLADNVLSFAVLSDPRSAIIEPLTEADERRLNEHLKFYMADTADNLSMALAEEVPGKPLWPWFMLAALVVLLGEIAVSRFITLSRQTDAIAPVAFDAGSYDTTDFKSKVAQWFPNHPA